MSVSDWEAVALDDVASFASGKTPSRARQSDYFDRGTVPWVKTMDLTNAAITKTEENVTPQAVRDVKLQIQPVSTVLVAMYGGFKQIGRTGLLQIPAATNQAITAVLPSHMRLSSEYLLHLLNYRVGYWRTVASSSRKDPNITKADVKAFPAVLPPIPEQEVIASAISDADDLIRALCAVIAKKQAIKQGMLQQLLTGRTRLPGFAGPWHNATFEMLAAPARERVDPRAISGNTRLIELEHLESETGRLSSSSTADTAVSLKSVFRPGDVLFGKLRAYLRKYWLTDTGGLCSTEFWVLRPTTGHASEFVRYVVETDSFVEAASGGYGTHMPRADWGVVRKLPVSVPEADEQRAIADVFVDADHEIDVLRDRLDKARAMKQGMMQQLLTGRTRLPVWGATA